MTPQLAALIGGSPLILIGVIVLIRRKKVAAMDDRQRRAIFEKFHPQEKGQPLPYKSNSNVLIMGLILIIGGLAIILAGAFGAFG